MHLKTENGNLLLIDLLREQIARIGPLSFEEFMSQALYHPWHGYYTKGVKIGRQGDFFTSVSVGPFYGELLAFEFAQNWEKLDKPDPFFIVEQGAHNAQLAIDILQALRQNDHDCFKASNYLIVEPSAQLEQKQRQHLRAQNLEEKTSWFKDIASLPNINGIFFSNELIDSFPTHRIIYEKTTWLEIYVDWNPNSENFFFCRQPIQNPQLLDTIRSLPLPPLEGYTTEVCLRSRKWMKDVAIKLSKGFVITIDYGSLSEELYRPERNQGTLRCYHAHRVNSRPLNHVGEQDITAHVDFSALIQAGQTEKLKTQNLTDQHHFLLNIAQSYFSSHPTRFDPKKARALHTLTHPQLLGASFKSLVQSH